MGHRAQVAVIVAAGALFAGDPAEAGFVTLWDHSSGAPTTPWTVQNGAPSDVMSSYPLGQPIVDFPVFSGPVFVDGLAMTGEDPSQLGFAVKIGGVASGPNVGHTPPLCLITSFAHPMFPDTVFNITMKFELPLFDSAAIWHRNVTVKVDPDAAPGEDNFWVETGTMVKFVASSPGRFGTWLRLAKAQQNGRALGPDSIRRLDNYLTMGDIVKVEEPLLFHGRIDMEPPPPGMMNEVDIDITMVDTPAPGTGAVCLTGALLMLRRRRG